MRLSFVAAALCALIATPVAAQNGCGGSWSSFTNGLRDEAVRNGLPASTADRFFSRLRVFIMILSFPGKAMPHDVPVDHWMVFKKQKLTRYIAAFDELDDATFLAVADTSSHRAKR